MASNRANSVFANRSFLIFVFSSLVSLIGDQLTIIALPWLMLHMTHDPLAVSAMFGLLALPRALIMLVGGSLADRFNAKRMLMGARLFNFALLAFFAVLALKNQLTPNHLYVFAAVFGVSTALSLPASSTMVPMILAREHIQIGNAMAMGLFQLATLVGPVVSGAIIYSFERHGGGQGAYALIFALDSFSFLLSVISLRLIKVRAEFARPSIQGSVVAYMAEGFRYVGRNPSLRMFLIYSGVVSFFVAGPIAIGIPLLVKQELGGTAQQYGHLLSALNLGALLAVIAGPMMPRVPSSRFAQTILGLDACMGVLMILFVNLLSGGVPHLVLLIAGFIGGYVQFQLITRIQMSVERAFMGRVMGFFMFAFAGLIPVSVAVGGFVLRRIPAEVMFEGIGVLITLIAVAFMFNKDMRDLVASAPEAPAMPETVAEPGKA